MIRKEIINQISQAIRRVDPTATAILYGSEARGDARGMRLLLKFTERTITALGHEGIPVLRQLNLYR